ncbi:universal stress protein [Sinomicrobium pectinilyticum]|uniref:Universal stress protein n=1 Tax=Sinomicrobium pectinilyticum TaxID=1084421 RepID=A0A3N0DHX6_SINP1|nr:universal stress protein [Sinomicrobium pectinilyticum]RNL75287.1 universal stress protein [Sinomicrobium pectinilyticum]
MKNILIPTDFSENSWNAVKYAMLLFKEFRCSVYLLHVTNPHVYATSDVPLVTFPQDLDEVLRTEARKQLQKVLARIKEEYPNPNHHFTLLSEYDFLIDTVRKQVEEKKIDLIVMGTKGASGLKEVILGSNTGAVITKVKCPVLAVPEKVTFHPPREIAFPTDYTITYSAKVLDTLLSFAEIFRSAVSVLHVVKKEEETLTEVQLENKEFLRDYLQDTPHSFHRLTNKNLGEAIQCFTESRDVDCIAMMAKKLHLTQQILFRPRVAKISYHTKIPFLVLHE